MFNIKDQCKKEVHQETSRIFGTMGSALSYIQKNTAAITLILTFIITLGSAIIRFCAYLFDCGYTTHFNIPRAMIDVSGDNLVYEFFGNGVIALIVFLLNFLLYGIWRWAKKVMTKIVWNLCVFVGLPLLLVAVTALLSVVVDKKTLSINQAVYLFITGAMCVVSICGYGLIFGIGESINRRKVTKDATNDPQKPIKKGMIACAVVIALALLVVFEAVLIFWTGYNNAANQSEFTIITLQQDGGIECDYAVIYETAEKYVLTKCIVDDEGNTIDFPELKTQKVIKKGDIEYQVLRFKQKKGVS